MFGIDDGLVGLAYLLCLASAALCVIYAWRNWNKGDDSVQEEDQEWTTKEAEAEEKI
jgi:hypothetical protein